MDINKVLSEYSVKIADEIVLATKCNNSAYEIIEKAMRHTALSGGKRIRPALMLEFYKACGGEGDGAVKFATALEMIHTYSLIHDDLPCMDNDDFRRGKPACHKVYGENIAVLAGDALLTQAFSYAATTNGVKPELVVKAIKVLADCAGEDGMIGGQVIDVLNENNDPGLKLLNTTYLLKTAMLLKAAAQIGCILADREDLLAFADCYAENVGIAFQIVDDVLDLTADEKTLGKPIHSDEKNGKFTYPKYLGIDASLKEVADRTEKAVSVLSNFGNTEKTQFLKELALFLSNRAF